MLEENEGGGTHNEMPREKIERVRKGGITGEKEKGKERGAR